MTVIAYRNGVIAADSAFVQCDAMWGTAEKIWRREDGVLIGAHGDAGYCETFRNWVMGGEMSDPPKAEKDEDGYSCGLIVRPCGSIEVHTPSGVLPFAGPYYAMGAGSDLALGAMAFGASPDKAVAIACDHHVYCGGPVTVLRA